MITVTPIWSFGLSITFLKKTKFTPKTIIVIIPLLMFVFKPKHI